MIRVLFVLTKPELGGAQKHVLSLLENIDKTLFELNLYTAKNGYLAESFCSLPGVRVFFSSFLDRDFSPFKDILALIDLYFFIKKNRFEIVHTHSSKAGVIGRIAARLAGVKFIVHTVHGWSFNSYQSKYAYWIAVALERLCARFTHVLIVVASMDQARGLKLAIKPLDAYVLIRCGIRFNDYQRPVASNRMIRTRLGISPDCQIVGTVACWKPQKDPLSFLRMAKELKQTIPEVKFLMVGDGVFKVKINSFLHDNDLVSDVILTGWRDDIPDILSIMDVFILTSLYEGLPVVVLEAMAANIAVIATDTGGVGDVIIPGETGELVEPGNYPAMTAKVAFLLKNTAIRQRLAINANLKVMSEEFSIEGTSRSIEQVYLQGLLRMTECPSH